MSKFMNPDTALKRLVEDDAAPVGSRVRALRQLAHPPLCLLRRLLVDTAKRTKPVPSRLLAIAALKYAFEVEVRKLKRKGGHKLGKGDEPNALGI
jgi:hypothetical protein